MCATRPPTIVWLAAALLATGPGCGSETAARRSAPAAQEVPSDPPILRLERTVLPRAYNARLTLDPGQPTFDGEIHIEIAIASPVSQFWLNAERLTVREARVVQKGRSAPLEIIPTDRDFVGFRATSALEPGTAQLILRYSGTLDDSDTYGIFRQKDGGHWYAFTQFESLGARRAFPCFDEPDNKVPWQLSLIVPDGLTALANTPMASVRGAGDGMVEISFTKTHPLPAYLIAFAVGPFDLVDLGATRWGAPVRVAVPRGRGDETAWVQQATLPLLALLEDYVGVPYPYPKLDLVSIPETVGFGAMENPGLITYTEKYLLSPADQQTTAYRRGYASVAAHELAHQWFGNLVTTSWWDDIWLNEAFATWAEAVVLAEWQPDWDGEIGEVQRKSGAMRSDSLATARRIHEPIRTADDIDNAFDGITYSKGASIIKMFEEYVGAERFRAGIRHYLKKRAHGNATTSQFLADMDETLDGALTGPFSSFLEQVGVPLVSLSLTCSGQSAAPVVELSQERYVPVGSSATTDARWTVPICVRYPTNVGETDVACTILSGTDGQLTLPKAATCPSWILPNAGGVGYYRSRLDEPLLSSLLRSGWTSLSTAERAGLIGDVQALIDAGLVGVEEGLTWARTLGADKDPAIASMGASLAAAYRDLVPEERAAGYRQFITRHFGPRARALGWRPAPAESQSLQLLRPQLLGLVATHGRDKNLRKQARDLAYRWLDDRGAVPADLVHTALIAAAHDGDRDLFERLHVAVNGADKRAERRQLLTALASFTEPALVDRALELVLASDLDIRESIQILLQTTDIPANRDAAYRYLVDNFDALLKRLPEYSGTKLAEVATAGCRADRREEIEALLRDKIAPLPGGPRVVAQSLERMDLCIARRQKLRFPDALR